MARRFSIDSMIPGYHEYALIWNNTIVGEELACKSELGNGHDLELCVQLAIWRVYSSVYSE